MHGSRSLDGQELQSVQRLPLMLDMHFDSELCAWDKAWDSMGQHGTSIAQPREFLNQPLWTSEHTPGV